MQIWHWVVIGVLAALGALAVAAPRLAQWQQRRALAGALKQFKLKRETLEARFFDLAAAQGKPRGLRWVRCDWLDDVRFAKDLQTGLLTAFAGVQIHFEALPGSDMEDIEAVGHFREASAVFHCQNGVWGTGGKALFNMGPAEAVDRLAGQYEAVAD
jgi:hypothetical protein